VQETQSRLEESKRQSVASTGRLKKDLDAVKTEKETLATKLADTEKQLADTSAKLRQTETDKRSLEVSSAQQKDRVALCEGNNTKLHKYGVDLLDAYKHKSCGDALRQAEPLTGLKQVEIENLMEDYRDKLDEQKISSVPASSAQTP
jgi:chromosome segregation ATPase